MNFTYAWVDLDHTTIKCEGGPTTLWIPVAEGNMDYAAFLKWCEEGNEPEPYIEPEPPTPSTPEEKLAASGLTVEELKGLLGL